MRQKVIAGNWKMNKTLFQAAELIQDLKAHEIKGDKKVILCAPFTNLFSLSQSMRGTKFLLGAQNMHFEDQGAFTGEISPLMLLSVNTEYVIIGHSERRQYFNETDEIVNKKVLAALKHGIKPIICVGETLEQREKGITPEVIEKQVNGALANLDEKSGLEDIIFAYEPIWAIGTGKTATPEDANAVCMMIRTIVESILGKKISENMPILYGGSVNSKNAKELFSMEHIDGGLVGGSSLKASEFIKIINYEDNND
jgi:triosephosphate isomerase